MQIKRKLVVGGPVWSGTLLLLLAMGVPRAAADDAAMTFAFERIGPAARFHPTITNVQIVDLDRDGTRVVVVCDAQTDSVYCYRPIAGGGWEERLLGEGLVAPAHATVVDLDQDNDNDLLVSVMGNLYPDDDVIGSLVLLENQDGKFVKKLLLDDVRRVVDAQACDLDGDGDLDIAVAVFGYLRGQVLWLENQGDGAFRDHELLSAPGTIHVPVADFDGDGDLDIAAVVSQEEEEVWGFENQGGGRFAPRRLWMTLNFDIGCAGLVKTDLDKDGDADLLLPVGDNLEDSFSTGQPYHGCHWLENEGGWKFVAHRIATFPGTYAAAAGDLDDDGDEDVVLCSMVNGREALDSPSLVWLENDGRQQFTQHALAREPIMLVTVDCGDLNADGKLDVAAGSLHMYPPYTRLGRVSSWIAGDGDEAPDAAAPSAASAAESSSGIGTVPAPNLDRLDALTRKDLDDLWQQLVTKQSGDADNVEDWLNLGRAYYAYGFFPAAQRCFETASQRDDKSFFANFLWGVSLARLGELPKAFEQFRRALPLADDIQRRWVQHEVGRCYLRLEDAEKAEAAFVAAGDYYLSLAQLAKLRIRSGQAGEAVSPLNSLARLQPGTTELFLLNARAAAELADSRMLEQFRDRAEYNGRSMPADPAAALADQERKKYGSARRVEQARRLIREKQWQPAATILKEVVAANRSPDAMILLAGAELEAGRPQQSIALLEALSRERGSMPMATLLLGDAYLAAGDADKALKIWEATERSRSGAALHERLAVRYEQAGGESAAKRQRALKLQAAGIAYLRQANPVRAKEPLTAAVELQPDLPRAWFYLGECHRVTGDVAAARAAYGKTIEYAPNHGRALKWLRRLSARASTKAPP